MKKLNFIVALVLMLIVLVGCSDQSFTEPSTQNPVYESETAGISIKPDTLTNEGLTLMISNKTDSELNYGMDYYIEKKDGDNWLSYNGTVSFIELAGVIDPEGEVDFELDFPVTLSAGDYRIIKPVGNESLALDFTIS